MINFSKLLTDLESKVEEKDKLPSITVKGIRTKEGYKGIPTDASEVDLVIIIVESEGEKVLKIEEGGVTGYESFYLSHAEIKNLCDYGWLACMGTPGSWDRLFISGLEMKKALEFFKLL